MGLFGVISFHLVKQVLVGQERKAERWCSAFKIGIV